MMQNNTPTPRIYVVCLAAYNSGKLHGSWIDCDQSADEIQSAINDMLASSPEPYAEEWAIHDAEGWEGLRVREYENIADLASAAELISNHGPVAVAAIEHCGGFDHIDEAVNVIKEQYTGSFLSLKDWAYEHLESSGVINDLPENLRRYFDYEAFGRDCKLNGDIFTFEANGQVHVFWNY